MKVGYYNGICFDFTDDKVDGGGLFKQPTIKDCEDSEEFVSDDLEDATEFVCSIERAVDCVNACKGIPTEELWNVKKAWIMLEVSRKIGIHTWDWEHLVRLHDLSGDKACEMFGGELDKLIRECR